MSFLKYLQLQPVEPDDCNSPLDCYAKDDSILLEETLEDEAKLEEFWDRVSIEENDDTDEQ